MSAGDWITVISIGSAGSLTGLAVAVELAGFSAFLVAAQSSAVIPLLGGGAAVSLPAVLASPLFFVPAVFGGAYVANWGGARQIRKWVASGLAIQLALHGLVTQSDGLKRCLDDFKSLDDGQIDDEELASQESAVQGTLGPLQPTPGSPEAKLPVLNDTLGSDAVIGRWDCNCT